MSITLPHTFHDGTAEPASGVQVMENLQALADALAGAWQVLPLGAHITATDPNGFPAVAPAARLEGMLVRLRGRGFVTGAELGIGETVFTLPVGYRPPATVRLWLSPGATANAQKLVIPSSGVAVLEAKKAIGTELIFDALTFNLA